MSLFKLQRGALIVFIGVITWHCIMSTHAKRIVLENLVSDFCRTCRDEEEEETIRHLLGTCPALRQMRRKYLVTYYMDDLDELSRTLAA